jgi:hypothetical protein
MVSFDAIRNQFKLELTKKPRGLTYDELNEIVQSFCRVASDDEHLFIRFDFWMRHKNHSSQIICANVELVRFGVLAARPPRQSSKENSAPSEEPSSADVAKLDRFLQRVYVEPKSVSRRADTVEARAKIVDNWVKESMDSKSRVELPSPEDIQPEGNIGNNRPTDMKYISLEQLVKCIARSENASVLKDYAMNLMALLKIYQEELMIAKDNAIQMKDDKIDNLLAEMKLLRHDNEELKAMSREIITINKDIKSELKTVNEKFDMLFDFVVEFAKMVLPAWIGSSVMKTQFKILLKDRSITYAMKHLKLMFIVGFYSQQTLIVYFCCRNFAEVPIRLRELYVRHADLTMLKPQAVCLLSCEINLEVKIVENMNILPADFNTDYNHRRKSYEIVIPDGSNAETMFDKIVYNARNENFQGYQARRDELLQDGEYDINPQIMDRMKSVDKQFFSSSLPFCQEYIECYIADVDGVVAYRKSSKKASIRSDLGDVSTTDNMYAMLRLKNFVEADTSEQTVDDMVHEGVITKKDISVLKKIAEVENVDISNIDIPDIDSSSDDNMPPLLTDDEYSDDE